MDRSNPAGHGINVLQSKTIPFSSGTKLQKMTVPISWHKILIIFIHLNATELQILCMQIKLTKYPTDQLQPEPKQDNLE